MFGIETTMEIFTFMNYYILKNSTGRDTGTIAGIQIKNRSLEYDYNGENSYQFLPDLVPPKITPNLDYFIIEKKAIMTDFISCIGIIYATGFIISEKAKQLFEQFSLMQHYFYSAKLLHKNKFHQYYWLHLSEDYIYYIDYDKSAFNTTKPAGWTISGWDEQRQVIKIDSPQAMMSVRKEIAGIRIITPTKLYLKGIENPKLDLLAFSSFGENRVLISERLKNGMMAENITGIELIDLPYPLITS